MIAVRPEPSRLKRQIQSASIRSAAEKAFDAACLGSGILIRSFHPLITLPLKFPLILLVKILRCGAGAPVQLRNFRTLAAFR